MTESASATPPARFPLLCFAPAVLLGLLAVYQALVTNNFNDFFIYRAGAEIGLRGESPYDLARIRRLVSTQFPDPDPKPDSFVLNSGYFMPPMAVLTFAPFTALSWTAAKVAWGVVYGLAAAGIAMLPDLFRKPQESERGTGRPLRLLVPFFLVLNPLVLAIVILGQVTILSVGCVALGLWCFSRGRPNLAVLLWVLPFIKPHAALPLIPLAWYLGGWKRAALLLAIVAALNLIGATVVGGSPLFLKDYLDYLPTGHKAVQYNQAGLNSQITSWNRLLIALGGPLIELNAVTTLAGYLLWGGLVVGRCRLEGARPSWAWASAAAVAGMAICSQVLAYELLMLAVAVPWIRDLLASGWRLLAWALVALLTIQVIPIDQANPLFGYYRPVGAAVFALLVLLGPINPRPQP